MKNAWRNWISMASVMLVCAGRAVAVTDADKCAAEKLKRTGQYAACRLKAEGKGIKTGDPPDYTKCDQKLGDKFSSAEAKYGPACPTSGDVADIQAQVTADTDFIALKLAGVRFVDNGNGTVTDLDTGLMWEKKNDGNKNDLYSWYNSAVFLGLLNLDFSEDGTTTDGCFLDHCDWRLPTVAELKTILLTPCATDPCIDPIFGPTQSGIYWSGTSYTTPPGFAWGVNFSNGSVGTHHKTSNFYVRAVRGGF